MCVGVRIRININKLFKTYLVPKCTKFFDKAFSHKYLLFTNVGISVVLSGVGDGLEQNLEIATNQLNKWDGTRSKNMCLSGASIGIMCHYWYYYLDKLIPGYSLRVVMKKILVDQFIGSPLCIANFFITINLMEKSTKEKFTQDLTTKAWKLYFADWIVWPPAQFINFYLLPTRYRVLFDNTISLGYDVYTSYVQFNPNAQNIEGKSY